jgi:hypothetical protein
MEELKQKELAEALAKAERARELAALMDRELEVQRSKAVPMPDELKKMLRNNYK